MNLKTCIVANWKMNLNYGQAKSLLQHLIKIKDQFSAETEVVICPSAPYLAVFAELLNDHKWIKLGAQNCFSEDQGAYTGEVSPAQLRSLEVDYCIYTSIVLYSHELLQPFLNGSDRMIMKRQYCYLKYVQLILNENLAS